MDRHHIPVARVLGIPIGIDYSWFLIFVAITWALAVTYYPAALPARPAGVYWLLGALTALALFLSVVLHELGHSVVALRNRIPVRRITLFVFGGVSQITAEPPSPGIELRVALAGPAVSFALALVFLALQRPAAGSGPWLALTRYLAYINATLGAFNLIPGFPLDGGRVLRALVWSATQNLSRATYTAGTVGRIVGFLFILWGVVQIFTGHPGSGVWIAFIGWFLESAATAEIQRQTVQRLLGGHTVAELMNRQYCAISPTTSLQELVDEHILGGGRRCFVVSHGDQLVGLVTLHRIKAVPRERWPHTPASEIMTPAARVRRVRPGTKVWPAMVEMDRDGVNQLPVVEDGRMVGMLTREDVISFLRTMHELES